MATTLAELLAEPTEKAIAERLIAVLKNAEDSSGNNPFIVNDFNSGSGPRTIIDMIAAGLKDEAAKWVPRVAAGAFPHEAEDKWLSLCIENFFGIERDTALATQQKVNVWNDQGVGPYSVAIGELTIRSAAGRLYRNKNAETIVLGTSPATKLAVVFEAESPGKEYIDGPGTLSTPGLVTPLPGLNVLNEQPTFSDVAHTGNGEADHVTPSETVPGTEPNPHSNVKITITGTGLLGAGSLTYELDADPATKRTVSPIPGGGILDLLEKDGSNTGIRVMFDDDTGTEAFINGDTYVFSTPSSPIVVQGRDDESDEAYLARAILQWAGLTDVPLEDTFKLWALEASKAQKLGVTKVEVRASDIIAGQADVIIAGESNPLPGSAQAAVQAYIDARVGILDLGNVRLANTVTVTATGSVKVPAAQLATVQAQAQANWEKYIATLPIAGDKELGGVLPIDELAKAVTTAGAKQITSEAFSASPTRSISTGTGSDPGEAGDLILTVDDVVAIGGGGLPTTLTWIPI